MSERVVPDAEPNSTGSSTSVAELGVEAERVLAALGRFPVIVENYLRLSHVPQTHFSKDSGGGVDFVRHMREGRDLRRSTVIRVLQHIAVQALTV